LFARLILTLLASVFVPTWALGAGETGTIACARIVSAALQHSVALGVADNELLASKAKRRQMTAQELPSLDLELKAARYQGLEDMILGPITIPAVESRYGASISLLQPVYTGGRLSSLRQSAALQERAVESARSGVKADVILQALTAYWGWSKAFQAVDVLDAAVSRMTAHSADIHNMHDAGLATDNEVLTTDVLVERTCLSLEQAQRQVELARARISFIAGIEMSSNSVPETAAEPDQADICVERGLIELALNERPERAVREMEAGAAKELARAARGSFRPQVFFAARYEQANPNMLYIPPADAWNGDAFAGVSVSWNILDWGLAQARADEADARIAQAQLRLRQQEELITLEVREAQITMRDAMERVVLSAKVLKSARLNLDSATELWKNGVARHSDVIDAHARLTDAQFEVAVSLTDVTLARAALAHATGQTVSTVAER
jgi:outer membrane protein TolC